jgi:hypothetical protein
MRAGKDSPEENDMDRVPARPPASNVTCLPRGVVAS